MRFALPQLQLRQYKKAPVVAPTPVTTALARINKRRVMKLIISLTIINTKKKETIQT